MNRVCGFWGLWPEASPGLETVACEGFHAKKENNQLDQLGIVGRFFWQTRLFWSRAGMTRA